MEKIEETKENLGNAYHFKLNAFEGPLDLLLFLIKKNEVSIYDIPIAVITEQYIQYVEYIAKVDLENITEFYVMAATLLYIKSRMLLPVEFDMEDDFEDPRQELVDKLIEYKKYKKLSELMEEKEKDAEWVIERKKNQQTLPFPEDEQLWQEISVWDLLRSFSSLLTNLSSDRIIDLYEEVSVNEKITLISELLEEKKEFLFTDLIINVKSVMDIVCAFLAVLESVKVKRIMIYQNKMFGDIRIKGFN